MLLPFAQFYHFIKMNMQIYVSFRSFCSVFFLKFFKLILKKHSENYIQSSWLIDDQFVSALIDIPGWIPMVFSWWIWLWQIVSGFPLLQFFCDKGSCLRFFNEFWILRIFVIIHGNLKLLATSEIPTNIFSIIFLGISKKNPKDSGVSHETLKSSTFFWPSLFLAKIIKIFFIFG